MEREPKFKMGLQLFSIRDALEKDVLGTLKTIKQLGYQDVETYGFDPKNQTYYGYNCKDFKVILDDLGLSASSGHYGFSDYFTASESELKAYVDTCIASAKILGKSFITWPWLAPEHRNLEDFKVLADKLNRIGEQVTSAGLGFAYHNHDFEFIPHEGQTGYDIIWERTDPKLVKLQLDLYWAVHSSPKDPLTLVASDPARFVMWHIKDMDKRTRDYTELGNGSIDYIKMLSKLDQSGLQFYYLEQGGNFAKDSMQSIAQSAQYFKHNLQHFL